MLIQEKIGTLATFPTDGRAIDWLSLEWYETSKRIIRKHTDGKQEVALRFLNENPALTEGDVLYADDRTIIAITILPCDAMVVPMGSPETIASACYEIGNRHLPLFIDKTELLAPFEEPLFRWLTAGGYNPVREQRKLIRPLRSTVAAHAHGSSGSSLFTRIIQLTTPRP